MKKSIMAMSLAISFSIVSVPVLALNLENLTATEVAKQIKNGEITSEELVKKLLERIKKNKELNAFISIDEVVAINSARAADLAVKEGKSLGKLHGVPFAIKDNIDVKGLPSTNGTPALVNHFPKTDAKIVQLLKKEGAIILGKTNMHELAFGVTSNNIFFGPVRNPYNKEYFSGGSSGGNGAAISARLVPIGIGTDTGGSIRIPSSLSGIYGYRPTVGRYSTEGVMPLSKTKDTVGPMARSVADLILVDSVVNNYELTDIKPMKLKGLRIGIPKHPFYDNLDPETKKLIDSALNKLKKAGVVLIETEIPDLDKLDHNVVYIISMYECKRDLSRYLQPYGIKIEDVIKKISSPDVRQSFEKFVLGDEAITDEDYKRVMTEYREQLINAYRNYYKNNKVEFIIFPTTVLPARLLEGSDKSIELNGKQEPTLTTYVKNTSLGSNAGMAGLSLPIGLTKNGLPVGLEVDVLPGNDLALLRLGLSLEILFGHIPPPKGF